MQRKYEKYLPEGLAEELGEALLEREIDDTEGEGQFNGAFWGQTQLIRCCGRLQKDYEWTRN